MEIIRRFDSYTFLMNSRHDSMNDAVDVEVDDGVTAVFTMHSKKDQYILSAVIFDKLYWNSNEAKDFMKKIRIKWMDKSEIYRPVPESDRIILNVRNGFILVYPKSYKTKRKIGDQLRTMKRI